MQKISHVSGLAYLHPIHLSIHPVVGPWFALRYLLAFYHAPFHDIFRSVVVVDTDGPTDEEFVDLQDPVPHQTELLEKVR